MYNHKNKFIFKSITITALALCACLLNSCATSAKFKSNLDSYLGADADKYIITNGPPSAQYSLASGGKVLSWSSGYTTAPYTYVNPYTYMRQEAPSLSYSCNVQLTVSSTNIIQRYSFEGNDCVSK